MNSTQCDSCGNEFDSEEEGSVDEMPDGSSGAICGSCEEKQARMAAEFHGDDLNR